MRYPAVVLVGLQMMLALFAGAVGIARIHQFDIQITDNNRLDANHDNMQYKNNN